jgi:hypothetical protein
MLVFTAWNLGIDVSSDGVVPARRFVDFANVRPSLAVGADVGTVVRLLLTTPRVAKFVELINDGGDIRDLGTALASDPSLEMIGGGPAMNSLDDNDVITHIIGTGILVVLQTGVFGMLWLGRASRGGRRRVFLEGAWGAGRSRRISELRGLRARSHSCRVVSIHHGTGNLLDVGIGKRGHASKILASDVDSGVVEVESGGETENIRQHAWSLLPVDTSRPQVSSKTSRLRKNTP